MNVKQATPVTGEPKFAYSTNHDRLALLAPQPPALFCPRRWVETKHPKYAHPTPPHSPKHPHNRAHKLLLSLHTTSIRSPITATQAPSSSLHTISVWHAIHNTMLLKRCSKVLACNVQSMRKSIPRDSTAHGPD